MFLRPSSSRSAQTGASICVTPNLHILLLGRRIRLRGFTCGKRLLEVGDDIVNVFGPNRNPDQIFGDSAIFLLLLAQLLVCS